MAEELRSMPSHSEKAVLAQLMNSMREAAASVVINRLQTRTLVLRCQQVFNTLVMIGSSDPSPNIMCVFRSGEYLLQKMQNEDWKPFALQHFTAFHLFEGFYERFKLVWSLHPTHEWAHEDEEDMSSDQRELVMLLMQNGLVPPNLDGAQIVSLFRRRMMSGWKVAATSIFGAPQREGEMAEIPNVFEVTPQESTNSNISKNANRFLVVKRVTINEHAVEVWELDGDVTPRTLEAFITDCVYRRSWCHPNLAEFHGAYAEKFDSSGNAYLSLGIALDDFSGTEYYTLHELLFARGIRFSIGNIIRIVLQVADALQYILFLSSEVPKDAASAWCRISPSDVYVQECMVQRKEGGVASGHAERPLFHLLTPFELVNSRPRQKQESVRLEHMQQMECHCSVKFRPPSFAENAPVSRWDPHPLAAESACYVLTELLVAGFTGVHPLRQLCTQQEIADARCTLGRISKQVEELPDNYAVPASLPITLQQLCRRGFAHSVVQAESPSRWRQMIVTVEPKIKPFSSLHEFRRAWRAAAESPTVAALPEVIQTNPATPFEPDMSDYGEEAGAFR